MYGEFDEMKYLQNDKQGDKAHAADDIRYTADMRPGGRKPVWKKIRTYLALVLVTSIVSSGAVGAVLYNKFSNALDKQTALLQKPTLSSLATETVNHNAVLENLLKTGYSGSSGVTAIAKKVVPSIVGIRMTVKSTQESFFRRSQEQSDEGSGIIVSKDGYILTNYHVVSYADPKNNSGLTVTLDVFLPDKREAKAKFVGGDELTDLAVLKISLDKLQVAELGDSTKIQVGELAVAVGNPLGMEFAGSVTAGVVSALDRKINADGTGQSYIQTDAAINPGNSGGALVNESGQVIGINSAKISETGIEGLGFAIPISDAKPIMTQLIKYGYVKGRPLIGIDGIDITQEYADWYGLPVGIYITQVTAGSGMDKAGIKPKDILISMDGKQIKTMSDLDDITTRHKAGDTVTVKINRDGDVLTLKVTFTEDR